MSYAFTLDTPASAEIYHEVAAKLGTEKPAGLIVHLAHVQPEGGVQHIEVWETKADWERFNEQRVLPAVREVLAGRGIDAGAAPGHTEIDLIDTWV